MIRTAFLASLLLPIAVSAADEAYPHPGLLVEPAALAQSGDKGTFTVVDARSREKYVQEHIRGAVWVNHDEWSKSFAEGGDADGWGKRIGALGIGPNTRIVVYDDTHSKDAARVWWILKYWGAEDVRLLNGGWVGWTAGGHPVSKDDVTPKPETFATRVRNERLAKKDELLKALDGGKIQIVDARSEKEFCGVEKLNNKRAGAIPGAKQLEWIDLLDRETQRFKNPVELRRLFDDSGITLDRPTATHCQSGGRAAVMAFGLELMGAKNVRNYYRSWFEWGNAEDTPVVVPKP